jgi:gamma-glutamyl-gamma-aminobutyrate hydrolase PuuD
MKKIAVTQRITEESAYPERRDALDQRWSEFLFSMGILPTLIPNHLPTAETIISELKPDGLLLTGGNSLLKYGGDAVDRDTTETFLLQWSIDNKVPVLGVCRGMQLIQDYFGDELHPVENHVGVRHQLSILNDTRLATVLKDIGTVNSFHEYGTNDSSRDLKVCARSSDGVVMAIEHRFYDIFGVMWHSEREISPKPQEKEIFNFIFK